MALFLCEDNVCSCPCDVYIWGSTSHKNDLGRRVMVQVSADQKSMTYKLGKTKVNKNLCFTKLMLPNAGFLAG